jgi:hypothetical protein
LEDLSVKIIDLSLILTSGMLFVAGLIRRNEGPWSEEWRKNHQLSSLLMNNDFKSPRGAGVGSFNEGFTNI